jgi:hypothetical protein
MNDQANPEQYQDRSGLPDQSGQGRGDRGARPELLSSGPNQIFFNPQVSNAGLITRCQKVNHIVQHTGRLKPQENNGSSVILNSGF